MTLTLDEIKANREAWYEALLSGKYTQTRGTLRDRDGSCCLGVYCQVKEPDPGAWTTADGGILAFQGYYTNGLPLSLRHSLGITSEGHSEIMKLNDRKMLSFPEIVVELRANPERYFEEGTF